MTAARTNPTVVVFGAGIAGLTAAHELIERGFDVTLYEPTVDIDSLTPTCAIGGMARSQWGRIETPEGPEAKMGGGGRQMVGTKPWLGFLPVQIDFEPDSAELDDAAQTKLDDVVRKAEDTKELKLRVEGWTEEIGATGAPLDEPTIKKRLDRQRALAVANYLVKQGVAKERIAPHAAGYGYPQEINRTPSQRAYVRVASTEALIPGEHGFRFFPSFYRHLFDTMARIPVYDGQPPGPTRRATVENIVPTYSTGLYFEDGRSFVMPRRRITSLQSMFDLFVEGMSAIGFTAADAGQFGAAVFKYMTSCPERRVEYEKMTWSEFLHLGRYSKRFAHFLDVSPQFLVAMRGRVSDARTIGNVLVQLLKDNVVETERPDGTLSGPTTTAWFDHWREYLKDQGVQFEIGRLDGFVRNTDGVLPTVYQDDESAPVDADYFVIAVPPHTIQKLLNEHPELRGDDYDRIRRLELGDPTSGTPGGTVEHMSGIQYYFASEIKFLAGHTHFPDSAWGLTAIFQPQFWARRRGWWSGYRGVLSVDIGDFHAVSRTTGKTAWESTADEIATEVWRQVKATMRGVENIPEPFLYHLDENLEGEPGERRNRSPLLINRAGEFHRRPGTPGRYRLHDDRIVFAGTYMQTYTRLTTMESANESGRHAVNAILRAARFKGDECMVVDPELHEFQDLRWLVDLDRRLRRLGLPHVVEILGMDRAAALLHDPRELRRAIRNVLALYKKPARRGGIRLSVR